MFNQLKIWIKKLFKIKERSIPSQNKFIINDGESHIVINSYGKNFYITGKNRQQNPIPIKPERWPGSNNRFKIKAGTRPKQCPVCRTKDKVTKLATNEWQCTKCSYNWN